MGDLNEKVQKGITEFYINSDINLLKKSLEEEGVDIDNERKHISNFLNRTKFIETAKMKQQHHHSLVNTIIEKFQDAINNNVEKPIATLKNLIETKQMSVQFRNLNKLTPEEIKEIIKGKNLVNLMDKLENEEL